MVGHSDFPFCTPFGSLGPITQAQPRSSVFRPGDEGPDPSQRRNAGLLLSAARFA